MGRIARITGNHFPKRQKRLMRMPMAKRPAGRRGWR
jgi:hypothetical protein